MKQANQSRSDISKLALPKADTSMLPEDSLPKTHRRSFPVSALGLISVLAVSGLHAESKVRLKWNPNPTNVPGVEDAVGYKVYLGTESRKYTLSYNAGNQTAYEINGLNSGTIYFATVTAIGASGNESDRADQIAFRTRYAVPLSPDNIQLQNLTAGGMTLSWNSNQSSTQTRIYFGTRPGQASRYVTVPEGQTTATISGLRANETYHFFISSFDPTTGLESLGSARFSQLVTSQAASQSPELGLILPVSSSLSSSVLMPVITATQPVQVKSFNLVKNEDYLSAQMSIQGTEGQKFWVYEKSDLINGKNRLIDEGIIPSGSNGQLLLDLGPILNKEKGFYTVASETR